MRHVGAVGATDQRVREALSGLGVDLRSIVGVDGRETGSATILVDVDGENLIVLDPGANMFVPDEVVAGAMALSEQNS